MRILSNLKNTIGLPVSLIILTLSIAGMLSACRQTVQMSDGITSAVAAEERSMPACSGRKNPVETLVCESNSLTILASRLQVLFDKAVEVYPDEQRALLDGEQAVWDAVNTVCMDTSGAQECIRANYLARISELQITTGSTVISSSAYFLCDAKKFDYLTAVFYQHTEVPTVVLTRTSETANNFKFAFIVPSGSGVKYQGKAVMFWNKSDEVQLLWDGVSSYCRLQPPNSGGI